MAEPAINTGWTRAAFGDVVRKVADRVDPGESGLTRYVAGEHMDTDELRIRRWGTIGDGYLGPAFHMRFKAGQVLYGSRRTYLRKVAVADFEGITANTTFVLQPKDPNILLPELLPFIMQTESFHEHSIKQSKGSVNPYINFSDLAWYKFALPPLEEQRRIAGALGALDEWYQSVRALVRSTYDVKTSFCRHVLTSRGELKRIAIRDVAKFTSGGQIRVSELPQQPTSDASVPVYGGNGRAGYTSMPLPGCLEPTVVVGRVGQYCGAALLTDGPAWITDNALYPALLRCPTDLRFLAACLEGANLNRGKLGEYLPLITQEVVHAVEIPAVPLADQQLLGDLYQANVSAIGLAAKRMSHAEEIRKRTVVRLLGEAS